MRTKTRQALDLLEYGRPEDIKRALKIVKGFRRGVTRQQRVAMERAWECMVRPGGYARLGYSEVPLIRQGIAAMETVLDTQVRVASEDPLPPWAVI